MNVYYSSIAWFVLMGPLAVFYSLTSQLALRLVSPSDLPMPLPSSSSLTPRKGVAIVTGSNTGIGFETARTLAHTYGYTVLLACRSEEKGKAAAESIGPLAKYIPLDLSNFLSVQQLVTQELGEESVEILVNNAGRNTNPSETTVDGLDVMFQTNFAGHFYLTKLMLEHNKFVTKNARIVNLSSVKHHFADHEDQLQDPRFWTDLAQKKLTSAMVYSHTKLAMILFSMELNRRYSDRLQAIAVNPGAVNSDIWRGLPAFIRKFVFRFVFLNNKQGSQTSVAAAVGQFPQREPVQYLQPYYLPQGPNVVPFPVFEMLGPFQGYVETSPRLPTKSSEAAQALWQAMEGLINPESCLAAEQPQSTTQQ